MFFHKFLGLPNSYEKDTNKKHLIRRFLPTWVKFKAKQETGKPPAITQYRGKCIVTEHRKLAGSSLALLGSLWLTFGETALAI